METVLKPTSLVIVLQMHRPDSDQQKVTDYPSATTRIIQLEATAKDRKRVMKQINLNKCLGPSRNHPTILRLLSTKLTGIICGYFQVP